MNQPKNVFQYGCTARGVFRNICVINRAGQVVRRIPDQPNLILDCGLDLLSARGWAECMSVGVAGTGTTDTREVVTGNYSQAGTTVTRDSGARDFTSGDVGKLIKFGSGEESKISAFIGATSVTVVETRTVGSTTINIYAVDQIDLAAEAARSVTYPAFTMPDGLPSQHTVVTPATGKILLRRTFDFAEEVGSVTYNEVGVSWTNTTSAPTGTWSQTGTTVSRASGTGSINSAGEIGKIHTFATGEKAIIIQRLSTTSYRAHKSQSVVAGTVTTKGALFSRVKLAVPVALVAGEQLRFTYELTLTIDGVTGVTTGSETGDSTGWPINYPITNITTDGAKMVVTTSPAHHFIVGGKVNLAGVVMPRTAITAASSTGSDFTVTAAGHGKSVGNSIVIQGVTPAGYNGTWTIASIVGDDITVTSALNPGTGTVFGTLRLADPSPWFNQEWTVAAVPTATTFEVTTAITPPTPQLPEGNALGNVKREFRMIKGGVAPIGFATGGAMALALCGSHAGVSENNNNAILDGWDQSTELLPWDFFRWPTQPTIFPTKWPARWEATTAVDHLNTSAGAGLSSGACSSTGITSGFRATMALQTYATGSFFRDVQCSFAAAILNGSDIKCFGLSHYATNTRGPAAVIIFEEVQKKADTHKLTFTLRRRWSRDLSVEP